MRRFLVAAALVLAARPEVVERQPSPVSPPVPPPRPIVPAVRNVLIVVVDTLRVDRLSAYAPRATPTPALDGLARRGQVFERAYAHASWTKPSVASLLAGVLPWRHGATSHSRALDPDVPLLAEHMAGAGFETGAFVANGYISERFGFERGFAEFRNAATTRRHEGPDLVEDLLQWIDAREDRPFFAYLHTVDVHAPYHARPRSLGAVGAGPYEGPVQFDTCPSLLRRVERGELPLDDADRARLVDLYDAGVVDHDELVLAPLIDGLEARGRLDDTLIVFTSDHGEELFDHGSVGHGGGRVWEELVHVPLVLSWPGMRPARRPMTVGLASIPPTVLEAVGLPVPGGMDGESLLPVLEGRSTASHVVLGESGRTAFALLGDTKLVRARGQGDAWIDLAADPGETVSRPRVHPKLIRRLAGPLVGRRGQTTRAPLAQIDDATRDRLRALGYVN